MTHPLFAYSLILKIFFCLGLPTVVTAAAQDQESCDSSKEVYSVDDFVAALTEDPRPRDPYTACIEGCQRQAKTDTTANETNLTTARAQCEANRLRSLISLADLEFGECKDSSTADRKISCMRSHCNDAREEPRCMALRRILDTYESCMSQAKKDYDEKIEAIKKAKTECIKNCDTTNPLTKQVTMIVLEDLSIALAEIGYPIDEVNMVVEAIYSAALSQGCWQK